MAHLPLEIITHGSLEILGQEITKHHCRYRLRRDDRVYYLEMDRGVYDDDTTRRPYLLLPALPELPTGEWKTMRIRRDSAGQLQSEIDFAERPTLPTPVKMDFVDILSLPIVCRYTADLNEVIYNGRPAMAKCSWRAQDAMKMLIKETQAYERIHAFQREDNDPEPLVPEVLAYLTENGRPMGILLEKFEGMRTATLEDLLACRLALIRLHRAGVLHRDECPNNFLIDDKEGVVRIIDFELSGIREPDEDLEDWKESTDWELEEIAEYFDADPEEMINTFHPPTHEFLTNDYLD